MKVGGKLTMCCAASLDLTEHDRAGAAVAFFGAGEHQVFARQYKPRAPGCYIAGIDHFAPSNRADGLDGIRNERRARVYQNHVKQSGFVMPGPLQMTRLDGHASVVRGAGIGRCL